MIKCGRFLTIFLKQKSSAYEDDFMLFLRLLQKLRFQHNFATIDVVIAAGEADAFKFSAFL